ncbi:hypothetical protein JCM5353_005684 [Sporobolomyces roseus]
MTSITTFAYSLTVRAVDLVAVASAWPQLQPVFQFFDHIYLRRKRGSLAGSRASVNVPVEVWERVTQYLVDDEIEDAVDSIARGVLKREECERPYCWVTQAGRYSWDRFLNIAKECDQCNDRRFDWFADLVNGKHDFDERIQDLVSTFGLAHPLDRFIRFDPDRSADPDAVAVIAIPQQYHDHASDAWMSPRLATDGPNENGVDMHAVVEVNLSLPPDSNLRFTRFIRTFNLKVFETTQFSQSSIGPRNAAAVGRGEPKDERLVRAYDTDLKTKVTREIVPRWRLYTMVVDKLDY